MDSLDEILKYINNNPMAYANADTNINNIHSAQYSQQTDDSQKGRAMDNREKISKITDNDHRQETVNIPKDKRTVPQKGKVIKSRSGEIVKKTGQTLVHIPISINPANMLTTALYVIQLIVLFCEISTFVYDILLAG